MRQNMSASFHSLTSNPCVTLRLFLGVVLILFVASSCSKNGDETETPSIVETPTSTPQILSATETQEAEHPEGWNVFTNEVYGYKLLHPASASITLIGVKGIMTGEVPEGVSLEEYIAQLQELLTDKLCVSVEYQLGHILINAPPNSDFRYAACGLTGLGAGELIEKSEEIMIGGKTYVFDGFEFIGDEETPDVHFEFFRLEMQDGTMIEFGSSTDSTSAYEEYLETTKETLLQIIASLDFSVLGTFDWDSYEPPPVVTPTTEGDVLIFVEDVTVPDGMMLDPEEAFTKTWRLQNGGENTWTTGYALRFHRGDQMGGPYQVYLEANVLPDQTVDLSVELIAPEEPGTYSGYWIMRNSDGLVFGTGPEKDQPFYVMIEVRGPDTGTATPPEVGNGSTVTGASLSANPSTYSGECPATISFGGTINSEGAGSFVYQLEAGTSTPGFNFSLPPAQKAIFTTGGSHQLNVSYTLDIEDSVSAWARLYISAPNTYRSDIVEFSVNCE